MRSVLVFLLVLNMLFGGKVVDLSGESVGNSVNNDKISIEFTGNSLRTKLMINPSLLTPFYYFSQHQI